MPTIPREPGLDSTLTMLSEGYTFIPRRARRLGSEVFQTRLMGRQVFCATGADAARMFYEPGRFTRKGALPATALMLLQDFGSVQLLDGEEHRHRKAMFMSMMTPDSLRMLVDGFEEAWRAAIPRWAAKNRVVLHREVQEVLCRAVCAWAGVPLPDAEARRRTGEFAAMIDGAGSVGPRNVRGALLRMRAERWGRVIIREVRDGRLPVHPGSPAEIIAFHRDEQGALLPLSVAAVELLNVVRPTVAVARYVVFAAHALYARPDCRTRIEQGDRTFLRGFVQEVRRWYPFFPAVGGRALEPFQWRGHQFQPGDWVLLDLYGTNRDPAAWADPDTFDPERFASWNGNPYTMVPQGGGDHFMGHRCAGEWLTIGLMEKAVEMLTAGMRYDVPPQDLRIPLSRMPAIPRSGFVIRGVAATDMLRDAIV